MTGSSIRDETEIHYTDEPCVVIMNNQRWVLSVRGTTVGRCLDAEGDGH
jgi:hypothetical protein